LLVVSLLFGSYFGMQAQSAFRLPGNANSIRLDQHVAVFVDSTNSVTFAQLQTPAFQARLRTNANQRLAFGYLPYAIWLRVRVTADELQREWYLEIPAPFLEYVDFYQSAGDTWQSVQGGYYRPHRDRGVPHTGFALPLVFNGDRETAVYVRIAGASPKTFPLYAIEKNEFTAKNLNENIGYGIFFGILGVMFFFNLIIGLTLRQLNYLLYVGTIFCSFFVFASASGYAGKYFWPDYPVMNFYAGRMILGVFVIFLALFAIRFLETKKYAKLIHYTLIALIPLAVVSSVLVATGLVSSAGNTLLAVTALLLIVAGVVCRINGNKVAIYFIAAWTFYLTGGLMLLLRNAGVFEFNFWTTHLPEIGAALETIIIAFALSDRYRQFKDEKEQAQRLALQVQREANEKLEQTVAERTEQLSNSVRDLNILLLENKQQTEIIKQKNAELDAFFYGVSHDLKSPVASLLSLTSLAKIEVDHPMAGKYFSMQERELQRLNSIIHDLVAITKIDHEIAKKDVINFDVVVEECLQAMRVLPNFDKIRFETMINTNVPFQSEWIFVTNILQNLIENAIKYAGAKDPFVRIRIETTANEATIEVTDNGLGIAPEHQGRVFDMFYRATELSQGTGLGLFILKRSVNRLKGVIEMQSELGEGSTFTVRLPH
jgi:signal transduction histidine kinase